MAEIQNIEEVEARKRFLREIHTKVVEAPEKPKAEPRDEGVELKKARTERARQMTRQRVAMGKSGELKVMGPPKQ